MIVALKFYIDGAWVDPAQPALIEVQNPATENVIGHVSAGGVEDVGRAVDAAKNAFDSFSQTTTDFRFELLEKIAKGISTRKDELAESISAEMGAPLWLARSAHVPSGIGHFTAAARVLRTHIFDERKGSTLIRKEPIGVCGLITPWNWPLNQIACKVAPAIAAGCTMVLKPSEISPLSAIILAEIIHDAGVPAGVFNLINGDGPGVGAPLSAHPDVDMVSFTGSTRAGVMVAQAGAPTVKRVAQELGGKSPNIILPGADLARAVKGGIVHMMSNSGQSCNAPSRMLIPRDQTEEAYAIARDAAESIRAEEPMSAARGSIGPISNKDQYQKVQTHIQNGIKEGALLIAGGPGRPAGLNRGFYVQPTVFGNVTNEMSIAREEIFGPVLCIIPYDTLDQAIEIANDTEFGLAGYVQGPPEIALEVASKIRAGQINVNGAAADLYAPFGGYKQSGNGREWGAFGLEEFLETKAILGASE